IPGLSPFVVTGVLKQNGFRCTSSRNEWDCSRGDSTYEFSVTIQSLSFRDTDNQIQYITARMLQFVRPNDQNAAALLGSIAPLPFDGAQATQARQWVSQQISNVGVG